MYKRGFVIVVLLGLVLSASLVSAQTADAFKPIAELLKNLVNAAIDVLEPILEGLLGSESSGTDNSIYVAKIFIFILVITIIYLVLTNSGISYLEKGFGVWLISFTVAVLGVRYLTPDFIYTIIVSNSALAVALSAGIPFLLAYLAISKFTSQTARRLSWIFFGVVFLAMWSSFSDKLGDAAFIYPLAAILSLIMVMFDGTFQKFKKNIQREKSLEGAKLTRLKHYQLEIADVERAYRGNKLSYTGTTPKGRGKNGAEAYDLDLEYWQEQIDKIK